MESLSRWTNHFRELAIRKEEISISIHDDWRLSRGQEDYLFGKTLTYVAFLKDESDPEKHAHCEFCWETISSYFGDENEAYQTEDKKFWICRKCFHDFNKMFNWKVR